MSKFVPQRILEQKSIGCGNDVQKFLDEFNLKLQDVQFDTAYLDQWSDYKSVVVEFYRDPTPSEVEQQLSEYTKRIEQETHRKYAQYEALKKEFEQKESLNENSK